MKFAHKLTLALLPVLALVLALCNAITVQQQFLQDYSAAQAAAQDAWTACVQGIQSALGEPTGSNAANRITSYLRVDGGQATAALLDVDGNTLYAALPIPVTNDELAQVAAMEGEPRLLLASGHTWLCAGSLILPDGAFTLVTAYSADSAWQTRTARLQNDLRTEALVLALAAVLVLVFCRRLTRPLARLEAASRQIAAGDYARRTAVAQDDEIGSLSRSFDDMAAAVQTKVNELNDAVRQREEFVAAFTHELKTPMTAMLGYAAVLRSGDVPEDTRRTAADAIYHESKRLETLSGHLLELMGLGEKTPELAPVALRAVFLQLRRALPPGDPAPTLPDTDLTVLAQKELLCDLLLNLVQNARHATPPDGSVAVEVAAASGAVTLTVRDTGCGIPPEELPHITEAFYMVDKSRARAQGGSGLGLTLCARIAALHGTQLQFESTPGRGTAVAFTLTQAKEVPEDA